MGRVFLLVEIAPFHRSQSFLIISSSLLFLSLDCMMDRNVPFWEMISRNIFPLQDFCGIEKQIILLRSHWCIALEIGENFECRSNKETFHSASLSFYFGLNNNIKILGYSNDVQNNRRWILFSTIFSLHEINQFWVKIL